MTDKFTVGKIRPFYFQVVVVIVVVAAPALTKLNLLFD